MDTDAKRRIKEFQEGNLVMMHLSNSRFPVGTYNKLKKEKHGPFKILEQYGSDAYKIQLPSDLNINPIFNVVDIYYYDAPDKFSVAT